ncbi:hypothetical protein BGW38_007187 [Lunasporangiospora selenospora]|uniref:Uncharacterized protein n=1 Tax=Lunasporangiospora selenospora TaxID=979761 RepID=A0A9P6KIT3_9FUNG|nr:hypothetical protein BGW38_007187 [Lunasporangiospora selenospora]
MATSRKLAAQALESLFNYKASTRASTAAAVSSEPVPKKKSKKDPLPKTKKGLKKIKHELRYGHSIKRRLREEKEANENPLEKLKTQQEKDDGLLEKNIKHFKVMNRASKKELELRKKIRSRRA